MTPANESDMRMNRPSLRDLVEKREAEEREKAKPRFLSKDERERLALERLHSFSGNSSVGSPADRKDASMNQYPSLSSLEEKVIDRRHLSHVDGIIRETRKNRRALFDWDSSDDTLASLESDPLYSRLHRAAVETNDPILEKEKHWTRKSLAEMTGRDWRIVREDFNISLQGAGHLVHPLRCWRESECPSVILEAVEKRFHEPTSIQRQIVPLALAGFDVIGLAETGSGKTLAYLLPILSYIYGQRMLGEEDHFNGIQSHGPCSLIMVPTRELAQQIEMAAKSFLPNLLLVSLVGGHRIEEQSFSMRNGAELVIGTPGRLRDFLERHLLVFNQCRFLVLDEADRMIDMNFEDDLLYILGQFPPVRPTDNLKRTTMMFSATMPPECEKIARRHLRKPTSLVTVGSVGEAVDTIEQRVVMIGAEFEKAEHLERALREFPPPIIVFVNQKKTVDYLCERLSVTLGVRAIGLHGGKMQEQREAAINQLRSSRASVLVATDVAGRGIDLPGISLVINYDMPEKIEDYVHRIGRTGRAGKAGVAISFLGASDTAIYYDLRRCLQRSPRSTVPPALAMHEASMTKPGTIAQKKRKDETIAAFGV